MPTTPSPFKSRLVNSVGSVFVAKDPNLQRLQHQHRKCQSAIGTGYSRHAQLYIEDLVTSSPNSLRKSYFVKPQTTPKSLHWPKKDVSAQGDFVVYQQGDLADFFVESVPQRVSQVCIVNDHFMLVKMPETCWRRNSQINSIPEEVSAEGGLQAAASRDELIKSGRCSDRKISRFWHNNRDRRIYPSLHKESINSGSNDVSHSDLNVRRSSSSGWLANAGQKEIFQSRTKILKRNPNPEQKSSNNDVSITRTTPRAVVMQKHVSIQEERPRKSPKRKTPDGVNVFMRPSNAGANQLESAALKTSLHDMVLLEPHGFIVTPIKTIQNGRLVEIYETSGIPPMQERLKLRRRFSAMCWLLKPFRLRTQTNRPIVQPKPKPKSKINAVVCKTYFVRWQKPADGRSTHSEEHITDDHVQISKRCRSATF